MLMQSLQLAGRHNLKCTSSRTHFVTTIIGQIAWHRSLVGSCRVWAQEKMPVLQISRWQIKPHSFWFHPILLDRSQSNHCNWSNNTQNTYTSRPIAFDHTARPSPPRNTSRATISLSHPALFTNASCTGSRYRQRQLPAPSMHAAACPISQRRKHPVVQQHITMLYRLRATRSFWADCPEQLRRPRSKLPTNL